MNNINHSIQIQRYKNEILNFFSKESESGTFRFAFLNNKQNKANTAISAKREDHAGCHCYVMPFSEESGSPSIFDDDMSYSYTFYGNGSSYYITFNEWLDDSGSSNMAIRADYISYLKDYEGDLSNKYFLFISKSSNTIYKIPFMSVLTSIKHCNKVRKGAFETMDIPVSLAESSAEMDHSEYKQIKPSSFNPEFFNSVFIGNFSYAKYRNATSVNLFQIANNEVIKQKSYRSIKELYDAIKRIDESDSLKSYKTFQRSIAKGDFNLTITVNGQVTFLVVSLNADINKDDFIIEEVIDETALDPFFDEARPETEDNPRTMIVKSHYELKLKKTPSKESVDIILASMEEQEVFVEPESEDENYTINNYISAGYDNNLISLRAIHLN